MKKILLSGVKPTGRPHIGNYFGAMKQFVDLQKKHTCYFMIADYHGLNMVQSREEMLENTIELAIDYLAIGLNPKESVIFKQSDVSAHTEMAWIFDTITTMPYLMRAHAYKDAEAKSKDISVGTFNYPMLMAADILLYNTDVVPVGSDQKQHVEIARDTAEKFNRIFGETFKLPKDLILESVKTVPGIDGQKMSKSYNNYISLFAEDDEIEKRVMAIVTDSGSDIPANVYAIHKLFKSESELRDLYENNKGKYKILKESLKEDIKDFIRPLREKRKEIAKDRNSVKKILIDGAEKAKAKADETLNKAKINIGVKEN